MKDDLATRGLDALFVSITSCKAARFCPASIAIHDNGDMGRRITAAANSDCFCIMC